MLPKKNRISQEKDIVITLKKGRRLANRFLNMSVSKNKLSVSRFGFVVSKKTAAKTTERNLIKRRLRAVVEKILKNINPGTDCLVIAKKEIKNLNYQKTKNALTGLLEEVNLIKSNQLE